MSFFSFLAFPLMVPMSFVFFPAFTPFPLSNDSQLFLCFKLSGVLYPFCWLNLPAILAS